MGRGLAVLHFKASSVSGAGGGTKALSSLVAEDNLPPPPGEGSWVTFLLAHHKWPVGAWLELRAWAWPPRINQSRQCGSSLIKVQGFNRSFKNSQITPTPGPATWPAAPGTRQLLARPVEARPGRGSCLFPEDAGRRARPTFSAAFNLP